MFALGGALAVAAAAMLLAVAPGVHLFQTAHPTAAPVLAGEDSDADRASWAASDPGVYGSEADEGSYTADVVLAALDDLGEDDLGEDDAL